MFDTKTYCPACDASGSLESGAFESNLGKVNYTLTYLCRLCGEQFDVGSCDVCHGLKAIDTMTDEPPFTCRECAEREEEQDE